MASETIPRQAFDVRELSWMRRFAADYAYAHDAVAPFFAGNPADPAAWRDTIARVHDRRRSPRPIAELLLRQQQRRGAPPEAMAAAERLTDPRTVAIVTGQQAGLFGGPLFTLLKALTALSLAARVSTEHGVPTVAVFWIDAEDHDWQEVASCTVLDGDLRPRTVALPSPPGAGEIPVAWATLDEAATRAVDGLAAVLPHTEFTDQLVGVLRNAYRPGIGMADAFGRWLESVLGRFGLAVYDSSDSAAKPLAREVFARELGDPGQTARLANTTGTELAALGYHVQVTPHDDSIALFHLDGGRRAVKHQGDRVTIGEGSRPLATLAAEAMSNPEGFSPNVLLRPIVQDTLFPTICYVAGPNELAYLGQLRSVYGHFGVPMPLIYPRVTATLVDAATARFLAKFHIRLDELQPQDEALLNRLLEAQLPVGVEDALHEAQQAIEGRMNALVRAVGAIDPTLEGAAHGALGRMQHELHGLHTKVIHAAKRRDETLRRQFTRAHAQIFPNGHLQERTLGFVYFLNRYGPGLVDRLAEELPVDMGRHWLLTI